MSKEIYFFDSYAIIEIIKGSPAYERYAEAIIITTKLNIFEVYLSVFKTLGEQKADEFLEYYYKFQVDLQKRVIKEAAIMRSKYSRRNVSMTDCIGYCIAKLLGIKFLTGDKEFKHLENVEFVK